MWAALETAAGRVARDINPQGVANLILGLEKFLPQNPVAFCKSKPNTERRRVIGRVEVMQLRDWMEIVRVAVCGLLIGCSLCISRCQPIMSGYLPSLGE